MFMAAERRPSPAPLLLCLFIDLVAFAIVVPLVAGAAARLGAGAALAGALVAVDSLLTALTAPWWGRLSDRVGRRPIILLGFAGSTIAYLLFGLADSIALILASRIVSGALGGTVTVAQASLADLSPPERRAASLGLVGAAFGLAFTIGPALGGIAGTVHEQLPGLAAAGLAGTNLLLALRLVGESRPAGAPRPTATAPGGPPLPWTALAAQFLGTLAFSAIYASFPLWAESAGALARRDVSFGFALTGLTGVVVQGRLVGWLAPRTGEAPLVLAGAVALAAGFVLLPTAGGGWSAALVAALILSSAGFNLVGPALAAWVSRRSAATGQGAALGRLQTSAALARIVGPPLLGLGAERAGIAAPFALAAGAAALAALVAWRGLADATRPATSAA